MEYLPNSKSPWLTYKEFVPHIMGKPNYDQSKHRGNIRVSCTGGNGRQIYIEFDSLPQKYKEKVIEKYGDPKQYIAIQPLKELLRVDDVARQWFATYEIKSNNGQVVRYLELSYQMKYARSADWLNLIGMCLKDKRYLKDRLGVTVMQFWEKVASLIRNDEVEHDLPGSVDRLRRIFNKYQAKGYECLVDTHLFGNDNARKVTPKIEGLILSLYCQPHKPYMASVCADFHRFMKGEKQVVDMVTGEVYDPKDFYVKGKPYLLGESTVDYYVKKPLNQAIVNKGRMKGLDYNTQFRPSVKRIAPYYAFSKITMDDIDIPFLGPDGNRPVKTYQIFDVASQAVIGVSFGRDKTTDLVREALRDMFRLIIRNGWGMPFEIEMEKHLTSAMSGGTDEDGTPYDDVLTPGAVFPATRICLGGNAKEKRAEHMIRMKKYQQQKKREGFMYRHYAKLLTNRLNTDKAQLRRNYEQIVQNELADIDAHNAGLHPKQDLYPGMTRWQVLEQNQNPNLPKFQLQTIVQFIGFSTETSIKAGKAQVQYGQYQLPDINLMDGQNYNGKITAYYLPDEYGQVNSVYLFEDGEFICEAAKVTGFQEAIIEQTAEDLVEAQRQWGQQSAYDKMVRKGKEKKISDVRLAVFDGFEAGEVTVLPPRQAVEDIDIPEPEMGVNRANKMF